MNTKGQLIPANTGNEKQQIHNVNNVKFVGGMCRSTGLKADRFKNSFCKHTIVKFFLLKITSLSGNNLRIVVKFDHGKV